MPVSREGQRPPLGFPVGTTREDAMAELHARIADVLTTGGEVPCVANPGGGWTSNDQDARGRAARRCLDCGAFAACHLYVESFPESEGVWAGSSQQPLGPEPTTYARNISDVWIFGKAKPAPIRAFNQSKEATMTKPKTAPTGICLCGCGEPTARNYRPGHDARHVGQLARAVAEGLDKRAALKALPTEPLRAKLTRSLEAKRPAKAAAVAE